MGKDEEISRTAPVLYIRKFMILEGGTGREKHQLEHRAGLELLKDGLRQRFGLEISDIASQIQTGAKGKPYLPAYPHIHFNISHSGELAVCALGSAPLGVDVEKIRPIGLRSTKRMLSGREREALESCPPEHREEVLFRFWTLKESYAKALGVGLGMDFTKVDFSLAIREQLLEEGWIRGGGPGSRMAGDELEGARRMVEDELEGARRMVEDEPEGARRMVEDEPEGARRKEGGRPAAGVLKEVRGPEGTEGGEWRSMQMVWEGYVIALCGGKTEKETTCKIPGLLL